MDTTGLGLDGTVMAQTRLGAIDGDNGRLAYGTATCRTRRS